MVLKFVLSLQNHAKHKDQEKEVPWTLKKEARLKFCGRPPLILYTLLSFSELCSAKARTSCLSLLWLALTIDCHQWQSDKTRSKIKKEERQRKRTKRGDTFFFPVSVQKDVTKRDCIFFVVSLGKKLILSTAFVTSLALGSGWIQTFFYYCSGYCITLTKQKTFTCARRGEGKWRTVIKLLITWTILCILVRMSILKKKSGVPESPFLLWILDLSTWCYLFIWGFSHTNPIHKTMALTRYTITNMHIL